MIWDGDSKCQHVWVDNVYVRNNDKTAGEKQRTNLGAIGRDEPVNNAFCQVCGAWRGCLGLEPTPELFIKHMVEIFREVRRVLRSDGTLWLNLGDSYWGGKGKSGQAWATNNQDRETLQGSQHQITGLGETRPSDGNHDIYKPKDLCGIPWRVALALQADGWWLRSDIIWHKPNPMPESVTDRPTKAHEYMFLLTKSAKYFYDAESIKEKANPDTQRGSTVNAGIAEGNVFQGDRRQNYEKERRKVSRRNKRTVWTIPTKPFPQAHFATFPPALIEPCILAGTSEKGCCAECGSPWERVVEKTTGISNECPKTQSAHEARGGIGKPIGTVGKSGSGRINGTSKTTGWKPTCKCKADKKPCTVLDPFFGSGTVAMVAHKHGSKFIGIELSQAYLDDIAIPRIEQETAQLKLW